jgi:patatin-like phospholipase/acyl hydrolase
MASQRPLRILSLDGGGVKGLASLQILNELMGQVRRQQRASGIGGSQELLRPCEYFDLICGTSTGGFIAIMLGRLKYVSSKIRKGGGGVFSELGLTVAGYRSCN